MSELTINLSMLLALHKLASRKTTHFSGITVYDLYTRLGVQASKDWTRSQMRIGCVYEVVNSGGGNNYPKGSIVFAIQDQNPASENFRHFSAVFVSPAGVARLGNWLNHANVKPSTIQRFVASWRRPPHEDVNVDLSGSHHRVDPLPARFTEVLTKLRELSTSVEAVAS